MARLASFGKAAAHGTLRLTLRAVGAAVGAVAALMVVAVLWLGQGPVSVGFLAPYLRQALLEVGLKVEIDDAVLDWRGFDEGLHTRLVRARAQTESGAQVLLPEVRVALSGRALLRGELLPKSIELDGPNLRLVRERDGHLNVGIAGDGAGEGGLGAWLTSNFAADAPGTMRELKRVTLKAADLQIDDRALGRTFRAPRTDLTIRRETEAVTVALSGGLDFGARPIAIAIDGRWHTGNAQGEAELRFEGLDPASLAGIDPALTPLGALRMPLSGKLWARFDGNGLLAPVDLEVSGKSGTVEAPDRFAKPLPVRRLDARASLVLALRDGAPAPKRLRVEHLAVAVGDQTGPRAEGSASLGWSPEGLSVDAQARVTGLLFKDLELYWPLGLAAKARAWVTANIQDGAVGEGRLAVNLPSVEKIAEAPRDAVLFTFDFDNVVARYLKPMPKITQGKGQARIDLHEFQLDLANGRAGKLAVSEGKLVIDGLHVRDQTADIQLLITGTVPAGLEVLDAPPLGLASRFGFNSASAGGNAAVRARFAFPLESWLGLEHVRYAVAANLTDVALKKLVGDFDLTGGALSMSVNPKGLAAEGKASLAGVPLNVTWREEFGAGNAPSRYEASGTFDDAARERLGLTLAPYLTGPVPVSLAATMRKGVIEAKVDANLAGATLAIEDLKWRKPANAPGRLQATVRTAAGQPIRLDDLSLDAADLAARGRVEIDRQNNVRLVELSRFAYADAELSLKVERDPRGNAMVALNGARLDLKRLNPPPDRKAKPAAAPPAVPGPIDTGKPRVAVKIDRLDRLLLSDTMNFQAVSGELDLYGGRVGRLRAKARIEDGPPIQVEVAPAGNRRGVQVTSADAAKLAKALDLFAGAVGGTLDLKGEIQDDQPGGPLVGRVLVDEFRVVQAPVLARILSLGSLTGIGDLLNGNGITFKKLEIPFTAVNDAYTIRDARAVGPALGITADGLIDRGGDRVDVRGTVVPAYTLNSVLGNIPLLGTLLVGRQGEGVFAINFRVTGSPDDPSVSVNPLSALAPGFLRTIMGVLERGVESGTSPPNEQRR